jgi:hypothetical protein
MDKPEILQSNDFNFNIWYETYDPLFSDISKKSRLPEKWISYNYIKNNYYKQSFIKPINRYVEELYPKPTLISINDNYITLRQHNHADFFLLVENNGKLYNVDRPWMRQYYNTKYSAEIPDTCFKYIYKFYTPWYVDYEGVVEYKNIKDSPFYIYDISVKHTLVNNYLKYLEPNFVPFSFKKIGNHMIDEGFGKILRGSPMFDIVFKADDIMINKVREFYEKN